VIPRLVPRLARLVSGLFLYGLGIVVTMRANIGYAPWEVFHAGLGKTLGISIGSASILVGLVLVLVALALGERPGLGTILNMVLIGIFMDLIIRLDLIPVVQLWPAGIAVLILGLFIISLASYFYIGSGFGAGPRDALMVALTRVTRLPIGLIRGVIELSATFVGWVLGGVAGLGTVIAGLAIGFCIQLSFRILRFRPTQIVHTGLAELYRSLSIPQGPKVLLHGKAELGDLGHGEDVLEEPGRDCP